MKTFGKIIIVVFVALVVAQLAKIAGRTAGASDAQKELASAIQRKLEESSRNINKTLPRMINSQTRYERVDAGENSITYRYTLVNVVASEIDTATFQQQMRSDSTLKFCASQDIRYLLSHGVEFNTYFSDREGTPVTSFSIMETDCR